MVSCAGPGSTSSIVKRPAWMTVTFGSPVTAKALPGLKSSPRSNTVPSVGTELTDAKLPVIIAIFYSPSCVGSDGGSDSGSDESSPPVPPSTLLEICCTDSRVHCGPVHQPRADAAVTHTSTKYPGSGTTTDDTSVSVCDDKVDVKCPCSEKVVLPSGFSTRR